VGDGELREVHAGRVAFVSRRAARWIAWLAAATYAVPLGMFIHEIVRPSEPGPPPAAWAALFGQTSLVAAALFTLSLIVGAARRYVPGTLSRVDGRLVVETSGLFGRSRLRFLPVRAGHLVPAGRRTRAELDLENGDLLSVEADDVTEARAFLRAAGVDAAHQRARIRLAEPISQLVAFVMIGVVVGLVTLPFARLLIAGEMRALITLFWLGAVGIVTGLLTRLFSLPEVTVGTDGVWYSRGPFRRFIPLSDIESVRSSGATLTFHLRGGRVRRVRSLTGADPSRSAALEMRVREALAAQGDEHISGHLELLDRRGRSIAAWSEALTGLARVGASYRATGLSADDLAAIVTSPEATPERRLGAALALHAAGHPAAAERIRVAAAQCASGRLRIALEKVGDGTPDLHAIDEALAETEAIAEAEAGAARR
jgi:hypothetical protein